MERTLKIVHFADFHLHNNSRQTEFRTVFDNFIDKCKEIQPDYIFFLGDWNHENTMLSTESILFTKKAFQRLSDICPVIAIRGNHDSALNNNDKTTTIESILTDFPETKHPIYAYYHSEWIEFPEFDLGVFDYMDSEGIFSDLADKPHDNKLAIALYHGIVGNARISKDNAIQLKNSHINMMPYFINYNFTFLGDIHQMQYMNEDGTAAYCGSLLQNNFSDDIEKGFMLWEINPDQTFGAKFIPVDNPYKRIEVDYNSYEDVIEQIRAHNPTKLSSVKVKMVNVDLQEEQQIIHRIASEIGIKPSIVNTKNKVTSEDLSIANSSKDSFYDVDYQNKMLKEYAISTEMKANIDDVILMNTQFNQELKFEYGFSNWNIRKLSFKNLFKYGGDNVNEIDFSNLNGIIGIPGDSAIGKSSIVYALSWLLYDKANLYDLSLADILNSKAKDGFGEVEFDIDNRHYVIRKELKRSGKKVMSTMLFWQILEDGTQKSENEDTANPTKAKIQKLIGTYDDFITTNLSLQGKSANFIESNNSEKKRIVAHFVGLKIFDDLALIAEKRYKELGERLFGPTDIDYYATQIVQLKGLISNARDENIKLLSDIGVEETNIKMIQENIESDTKQLKPLLLNPTFDRDTANAQKTKLESQISELRQNNFLQTQLLKVLYCENGICPTEQELRAQFKPLLLASNFNKDTALSERDRLTATNDSYTAQIRELNEKIVNTNTTESEVRTIMKELNDKFTDGDAKMRKIDIKVEQLKSEIKDINHLIEANKNGEFVKHDVCDTCGFYSWFLEKQNIIEANQKNIDEVLLPARKALSESADGYLADIDAAKGVLSVLDNNKQYQITIDGLEAKKKINQIEIDGINIDLNVEKDNEEIVKFNAGIQEKLDTIAWNNQCLNKKKELENEQKSKQIELDGIISDLNKWADNETIVELNRECNARIAKYNSELSEKQSKVAEFKGTIKSNDTIIGNNDTNIINYENKIKELEEFQRKYEIIDAYRELIKSDGLPEFVLEKKLEPLIDEINSLLSLTNYQINIILEKEGRKTQKISITYRESDNDWMSINLASGAERATLSLIFRIAMLKMSCLGHCSTLFIDELFSPLDANRLEDVESMLQIIKDYFNNIISISHIESIKRCVDDTINITNDGIYSYIVNE